MRTLCKKVHFVLLVVVTANVVVELGGCSSESTAPSDVATEAGTESAREAGGTGDAGTTPPPPPQDASVCSPFDGAVCDPFAQCGCKSNQTCILPDPRDRSKAACLNTSPDAGPGATCSTAAQCGPGMSCDLGRCVRYCPPATPSCWPGDDRPLGGFCMPVAYLLDDGGIGVVADVGFCHQRCELADPTSCGDGRCQWVDVYQQPICIHRAGGALDTGVACTQHSQCKGGDQCVGDPGSQPHCQKTCRVGGPTSDCPAGATCQALVGFVFDGVQYGSCQL